MSITVPLDVRVLEYDALELEQWKAGIWKDSLPRYFRSLTRSEGFGEFFVGRHFEKRGYEWIHHDFDLFGANKSGKYPRADEVFRKAFGKKKFEALRSVYSTLYPLRPAKKVPMETPDLLIFKPDFSEVRFAECKRLDTRDRLNSRQFLGLYMIKTLLGCPADVFVLRERGSSKVVPPSITLRFD